MTIFGQLLTTYLPPVEICDGIPLLLISENLHTVDISDPVPSTSLPRLVNVVCERPISLKWILISLHTMCSIHVFLFLTHVKIPENSINY